LNLYVRAYREANDTDDLLSPITQDSDVPTHEAVHACYSAFDWLDEQKYGARTKTRVRSVVDDWYQHLVGRRLAVVNPATGLYDEFKWQVEVSDPSRLAPDHVRALVRAAETPRERLLIVALAAWGLRANEVASLHISQFARDVGEDEAPYVTFEERKNGPGEVNLVYGLDALDERIALLADREDWSGYLFPSRQGEDPHVTRESVWAWFRDLSERAGLPDEIDGERPSPQLCRRYWYDTYTSVLEAVLEGLEDIAAEQGSDDPRVVLSNYLSDERARKVRREFMREELRTAFEGS
jgi:site-specific recombinase XerD